MPFSFGVLLDCFIHVQDGILTTQQRDLEGLHDKVDYTFLVTILGIRIASIRPPFHGAVSSDVTPLLRVLVNYSFAICRKVSFTSSMAYQRCHCGGREDLVLGELPRITPEQQRAGASWQARRRAVGATKEG